MVEMRWAITITVRPDIRFPSAFCTSISDSVSRCEVASSRIRIGEFFRIARAIASRCRCPPDSLTPRSPIMVSYPCGSFSIKSCASAAVAASVSRRRSIFSMP